MNLWNPKFPVAELPHLTDQLKHRLHSDGYRTVKKLDRCPQEQLYNLGYSNRAIEHIHEALRRQHLFIADLDSLLDAEGVTPKMLTAMHPFDLLALPLTTTQLGYIIRWQRDVGGRYGDKEIFCVAGGRVYYCTTCRYRDERTNFCGFCMKKLLDEVAAKKRGGKNDCV